MGRCFRAHLRSELVFPYGSLASRSGKVSPVPVVPAGNMCVGCRGFKVRMTEDLLNRTDLHSCLQAMRRV